jgi:hypothetical protein
MADLVTAEAMLARGLLQSCGLPTAKSETPLLHVKPPFPSWGTPLGETRYQLSPERDAVRHACT